MDVRNCRGCGRLFNYLSGPPICQACKDSLEGKFQEIREFLRDNPNTTMQVISDDFEVSVAQIRQWVREERLVFSPDSPMGIECEGCGKTIRTGRYCDECKNKVKNDLDRVTNKPKYVQAPPKKTHEKDKMRFLDK